MHPSRTGLYDPVDVDIGGPFFGGAAGNLQQAFGLQPLDRLDDGTPAQSRAVVEMGPVGAFSTVAKLCESDAIRVALEAKGAAQDVQEGFDLGSGKGGEHEVQHLVRDLGPVRIGEPGIVVEIEGRRLVAHGLCPLSRAGRALCESRLA